VGCFAVTDEDDTSGMSKDDIRRWVARGREMGATGLWIGGGEPTLRAELYGLVKTARAVGYSHVKLQTNGLRLAHAAFVEKLAEAGLTEVSFNVKCVDATVHDALSRYEGSFVGLAAAVAHVRSAGIECEADVLIYRENLDQLAATVTHCAEIGVAHVRLWYLSLFGGAEEAARASLVSLTEAAPHAAEAIRAAKRAGIGVESLHIPACVLPLDVRDATLYAPDLGLFIADAGGQGFMLEQSPIEGGYYADTCGDCGRRSRCLGLRHDYVEVHGDGEVVAL